MPLVRASGESGTFEHRYVDTSDVRLHYALTGSGERPALLLHGIGMDWRVWQGVSRRLGAHFRLYLVDLRGHGTSGKPAAGYTLAHYAADLEDMVSALDLSNVILVGSSLGGAIAVAVEAPADLISHRVLIDPPLTGGPIRDELGFRQILALKHEPVPALAEYLRLRTPGAGSFLLTTMSEMWHQAADGVILDMLAHPRTYYDLADAMRANDAPTLLLQADPDLGAVLTDADAERSLSLLPHGSLLRIPGAGHAIHAFKPHDFTRAVVEFAGKR